MATLNRSDIELLEDILCSIEDEIDVLSISEYDLDMVEEGGDERSSRVYGIQNDMQAAIRILETEAEKLRTFIEKKKKLIEIQEANQLNFEFALGTR